MANEIQFSASLSASKGGASVGEQGSHTQDMSGTEMSGLVQTIATSNTQLTFGGVDQVAALLIKNMDATNYVTISVDNAQTQVISVIQPGGVILLQGTSTTMYAKANVGSVDIFIVVVEN